MTGFESTLTISFKEYCRTIFLQFFKLQISSSKALLYNFLHITTMTMLNHSVCIVILLNLFDEH